MKPCTACYLGYTVIACALIGAELYIRSGWWGFMAVIWLLFAGCSGCRTDEA